MALEIEILEAWGTWYEEAIESCQSYFVQEDVSEEYLELKSNYLDKIKGLTEDAVKLAEEVFK